MYVITGALKNYEWGTAEGLRPWTDAAGPLAELWFGVHPSGVSPLVETTGKEAQTGSALLDSVLTREEVPILVKLLSAGKPLSVQVHPSAEFARRGFHYINKESEKSSLPFADEYEKTELLYALTDFEAFAGWRDFVQVRSIFASLSQLTGIDFFPDSADREEAFAHIARYQPHGAEVSAINALIPAALEKMKANNVDAPSLAAYTTVVQEYPHDPGCVLTLFLDVVHLESGQSIFVPSGVPHSYIQGTGLEVMTSSDNVLRLGLTPKPVFTELALEALDFSPSSNQEQPFAVTIIHDSLVAPSGNYRLILALSGTTAVVLTHENADSSTILSPGQAVVVTASEPSVTISTEGMTALVTAL